MGAAYADARLDGREYRVVKMLLAKVMNVDKLGEEMGGRLRSFARKSFDPVEAAKALGLETEQKKRHLIELIAAVTEADGVFDLDENAYIENVAKALELPKESYGDLTIEILEVENLQTAGEKLMTSPPAPPAKS
jgi:tellurite resistance protein